MNYFNPQKEISPRWLATDLDGTLIPLSEHPENVAALQAISEARNRTDIGLVFATGRHYESVLQAIDDYRMPVPDWIICDVGSSIYHQTDRGFETFDSYEDHLVELSGDVDREVIETLLQSIPGLKLQSPDDQQRFKISYESASEIVDGLVDTINGMLKNAGLPYHCMGSLDPFLNCGLLDVLPDGVSKAYALLWLSTHADFTPDEVIFSGDSGNDFAALVSGFRAIIVANASKGLADRVRKVLGPRQLEDRLYVAEGQATSGVLEGCRFFGLIE
ncbi:MAG: HAD-IIB family hydrolase [Verrucomicrobia bacterium]|nr:HAD-IIB family hydrolase [Verrucomicrobiota bacterium]